MARYREFLPSEALRPYIRALFSFTTPANDEPGCGAYRPIREVAFSPNDPFCSPLFADGHISLVFSLAKACRAGGMWFSYPAGPRGDVIGPMTRVGAASMEERPEMLGAYLRRLRATICRLSGSGIDRRGRRTRATLGSGRF